MTPSATTADDTEQPLQLLEPLLRVVATAAGLAAALRLAEQRGGVRIYVPHNATADHDLAPIVTLAGLQALSQAYPGEFHVVPKAVRTLRAVRNLQIHRSRRSMSLRALALEHHLTRRRIEQIMAEGCGQLDDEQADMFR